MAKLETELFKAVRRGDAVAAKALLQKGAGPRIPSSRASLPPLHLAAKYGHLEVAELLLKAGVPVDDPKPRTTEKPEIYDGMTPLQFAADDGRTEVLMLLLNAKANPNSSAP